VGFAVKSRGELEENPWRIRSSDRKRPKKGKLVWNLLALQTNIKNKT
jgi:hypothetical protein